ncbi:uncharacterized protein LOC126969330 [Leptidea sinapis]|uniref:Uncharacterized protein n=1 Tax=Leptidea sinapis TaxID=189913 RepID=A0A5E4QNE0_9NEOP|nr:uncharacterized protein LOC126969330 [Leptidea sinapis]VVC99180.1 unnamed protein product [Leptidea sinapis]
MWAGQVVLVLLVPLNAEIRSSVILNKLINVKPVGGIVSKNFVPLTEIPPPKKVHVHSGRRHLEDDCSPAPSWHDAHEGGKVDIMGDYYDDGMAKTVATVVIPDHIDTHHFQVTTQVPYLTLGTIDALGYHPSTIKSEHPSECEKIYQDHIADQYSDEMTDYSEESLEMARMPLFPTNPGASVEQHFANMYDDMR